MRVVALYSPAPQSGKTTVANHLVEKYGFVRIPFAKVLKEMLRPLYRALGYTDTEIEGFETINKTAKLRLLDNDATPRKLMQKLGTEWGRVMIDEQVWLKLWLAQVLDIQMPVVVDDMRFENEFELVQAIGGITVKVVMEGNVREGTHASEGALDNHNFDITLNSVRGDLPGLLNQADAINNAMLLKK